jgi:hypothetical protein
VRLGVPTKSAGEKVWETTAADEMDQVGPFGADLPDFGSLDEVAIFEAFRRVWGGVGPGIDAGPWVLLGHTHVPLTAPCHPESKDAVWRRYVNSGCGIFPRMVTSIEWDFTGPTDEPSIVLVAWRWHQDISPLGPPRGIVARRLVADFDSHTFKAAGDFPFDHPVPPGV